MSAFSTTEEAKTISELFDPILFESGPETTFLSSLILERQHGSKKGAGRRLVTLRSRSLEKRTESVVQKLSSGISFDAGDGLIVKR